MKTASTQDQSHKSSNSILLTVKEFQKQAPISVRWAIQRNSCRLEEIGALIRYGRKLLIDPEKFYEWLKTQN